MCFKNFRERLLRAYACVVRKVLPTYAVKCLTKRYVSTKWGSKKNEFSFLFCPGVKKELKAIEKLGFDAKALQEREWSYETELELLKQGNYALVDRIKTEEALKIVVEQGYVQPIVQAIRVCTPSKRFLISLICDWDREKLLAVISAVPSAFDSLTTWEVFGVEEKTAYEGQYQWAVAQALIKAKPTWAPKFIDEATKIVPSRLNEEAIETIKICVETAVNNDINIATNMSYLMVIFPNFYAFVRASVVQSKHVDKYVMVMLPQLITRLGKKDFSSFYAKENSPAAWRSSKEKLSDAQEAACWLYFGLRNSTLHLIVEKLSFLKSSLSEEAFEQLTDEVVRIASNLKDIETLMRFFKDDAELTKELRSKLLKVSGTEQSAVLLSYFPFADWQEKDAERAVRQMAEGKTLPADRMSELSEKLQKIAIEELEIQSEIAVIRNGNCGDKEILVKQKLHPRSEVVLFTDYYGTLDSYAPMYVQNYCMAESSFKAMIQRYRDRSDYDIEPRVRRLISLHAEKWGLSKKNYQNLLQSPYYSDMAAVLKRYLKKEDVSES